MRCVRLLMILAIASAASPALACSPKEGYRTPTNFELVQKADLIVLARVIGGVDHIDVSAPTGQIQLATERILKGTPPASELTLFGELKWNENTIPSLPTTLDQSHFSAGLGACVRIFYAKGALVVAMFEKRAEGYVQIFDPWARAVEDVEGPTGVWVRAVEEYLDIQSSAKEPALRAAVDARRKTLLSKAGDNAAHAMAEDLQEYLDETGPSTKPDTKPRWRGFEAPKESVVVIGAPGSKQGGALICREGQTSVIVDVLGAPKVDEVMLSFNGQSYLVQGAEMVERPGMPEKITVLSGQLPWTSALSESLKHGSGGAGISIGGKAVHSAPPLDALEKFALRCETLLKS